MSWGTELWDQFETLSIHTQKGIDFLERYAHFIRDRCAIEVEYATKLRRLVKSYQPKKKDEEDYQYSSCKAFRRVMGEVTDLAGQHEVIAENLQSEVIREVSLFVKDIKEDRKKYLQDGARYMALLSSQIASLERSKKIYEKASKETERAVENFQRADADLNLSRAEVEKQRLNMSMKTQNYEEAKTDYANELQKTNDLQHQHYYISMPEVFKQLQELDEKRICSIKSFMVHSAEIEKKVFPIIDKCLDGIIIAANEINEKEDTSMVIERYKSGFSPPEDIPFIDLHVESDNATIAPNGSKNSTPSTNSKIGSLTMSNHNGVKSGTIRGTIISSKFKNRRPLLGIFSSNKDDFSNLPPIQKKKKLQQRLDDIRGKIHQETAARDGLMKMKCVYEDNPALGDPMSIEGQLNESGHRLDKLKGELQKYQNYLDEVENNSPSGVRKSSIPRASVRNNFRNGGHENETCLTDGRRSSSVNDGSLSRSASESSVTITNQFVNHNHTPNHRPASPNSTLMNNGYSNSPESGISTLHPSLPDTEIPEYYDPPALGMCKALYPFEATSEGSIPMHDGEELFIIELDQGDGWTRVRRQTDREEGFVPTSYIECTVYDN